MMRGGPLLIMYTPAITPAIIPATSTAQTAIAIIWHPTPGHPAFAPDCAGCHEGDFEPDKHEKDGGGLYSVSELRDCSGACHKPSGEHRVSDSNWD